MRNRKMKLVSLRVKVASKNEWILLSSNETEFVYLYFFQSIGVLDLTWMFRLIFIINMWFFLLKCYDSKFRYKLFKYGEVLSLF